MSFITHEKHRENLLKTRQVHDAKKAILQSWEEWRQGKIRYKRGEPKGVKEDPEYERDLTRRVRNLYVRLENMKPISELDDL